MKAKLVRVLLIASVLVFLVGCPELLEKPLTLSIPDQEVLQGETLQIELLDHVSGGIGTLVFTIEDGVGDIYGSTYTYAPGYDVFDNQSVTIRVKDDRDESVEDTFEIVVEAFEVKFEDENLEAVVREAINKPEGPIFKGDVQDLTKLFAKGKGIESLEGIQHLGSLEMLNLNRDTNTDSRNYICDLSPLSNLTSLQRLSFNDNSVEDISPLAGLTNLELLSFGDNLVNNISPLAGLTNLVWLAFEGNSVNDISPLSGLTNLEFLHFPSNIVSDISALVDNAGIAAGDYVDMRNNYLDLTPGSQNMNDIQTLLDRDVEVDYEPQREPGESAAAYEDCYKD